MTRLTRKGDVAVSGTAWPEGGALEPNGDLDVGLGRRIRAASPLKHTKLAWTQAEGSLKVPAANTSRTLRPACTHVQTRLRRRGNQVSRCNQLQVTEADSRR